MRAKIANLLLSAALLVAMTAGPASALTFYLDQNIGGGPPVTSIPSYGTITLSDVGDGTVKIDVSLTDSTLKLQEFALNFNGSQFGSDSFSLSDGTKLTVNENGVKQDGYAGFFDINIPSNGNLGVSTYSAVLTDKNRSLTSEDFDSADTLGLEWCSAHVGGLANGNSIWLGSDGQTPTDPVPEPGTMMLLGAGFLGLAVYGKRRRNA